MSDDPGFYKDLLDNLHDGVYFVDRERVITSWNKGAERITGYGESIVLGKSCRDNLLNHIDAEGNELCGEHCPLAATMEDGQPREVEVYLHHADGHRVPVLVRAAPLRDGQGRVIGAVETFSENTVADDLRRRNEQLSQEALLDPLTEVGNRRLLEKNIRSTLAAFRETGAPFSLLFIDLDHFKQVNDTYGHEIGDQVLKMVASTLQHSLRPGDRLGRWGGEEFIILLPETGEKDMKTTAEKLQVLVNGSRLDLEMLPLYVTVSIGATVARAGDDLESLVRRADELMYHSKNTGRNRITCG